MKVSVTNLQHKYSISQQKIVKLVNASVKRLKLRLTDVSIVVVGEQRMRTINKKHLGHDYVTDVITFAHGEVIVCPAEAARNACEYGNSVDEELLLYVVHGLLHLAGYDDHKPEDIKRMREMERKLLSLFPSP